MPPAHLSGLCVKAQNLEFMKENEGNKVSNFYMPETKSMVHTYHALTIYSWTCIQIIYRLMTCQEWRRKSSWRLRPWKPVRTVTPPSGKS